MRLLLVFALFLACAFAQNTCFRPLAGNVFVGAYPNSSIASPILRNRFANRPVQVTFGSGNAVAEESALAAYSPNWDINNLILKVTDGDATLDSSLNSDDYTCDSAIEGLYQVKWEELCTQLTIDVVQDECYSRRVRLNGLRLHRVPSTCSPGTLREELWNGKYTDFNPNNELNGMTVQFVVRPGTSERDVLEQSVRGTRRSNWRLDGHHLIIYDVSSRPKFLTCSDVADRGIYLMNWSSDCSKFKLTLVSDSCRGRSELYFDMEVSKGGVDIPRSYSASASLLPPLAALLTTAVAVFALF